MRDVALLISYDVCCGHHKQMATLNAGAMFLRLDSHGMHLPLEIINMPKSVIGKEDQGKFTTLLHDQFGFEWKKLDQKCLNGTDDDWKAACNGDRPLGWFWSKSSHHLRQVEEVEISADRRKTRMIPEEDTHPPQNPFAVGIVCRDWMQGIPCSKALCATPVKTSVARKWKCGDMAAHFLCKEPRDPALRAFLRKRRYMRRRPLASLCSN